MAEEFSLDDTMESTLAELKGGESDEVETEDEIDEGGRERDEKGRFVSKSGVQEDEGDGGDETASEDESREERTGVVGAVRPSPSAEPAETRVDAGDEGAELANPPTSWTVASKSKWKELPSWAREEINRREVASYNGVQQLKERAGYAEQITRVIEPYRATINARGVSDEQVVQTMLNAYYVLETANPAQKAQTILDTAQQYGCLNEVMGLLSGQIPRQAQQPQDVSRIVEEKLAEQRRATEAEQSAREVREFESAKNADGSLVHPYFNDVRTHMAGLIQANPELSLEEAYDHAIWANPSVREVLVSQQAQNSQREAEAKARKEKAKKAKAVDLGKKPSYADAEQPEPTGSVDDTLRATMEKLRAAG